MKEINEKIQQEAKVYADHKVGAFGNFHKWLDCKTHFTAGAQFALQELSGKGAEGKWDKLNKEFDDIIDNLTPAQWKEFDAKCKQKFNFTTPPHREGEFAEWVRVEEKEIKPGTYEVWVKEWEPAIADYSNRKWLYGIGDVGEDITAIVTHYRPYKFSPPTTYQQYNDKMKSYYIRIESHLGYFSFYRVNAANDFDAGIYARKQFAIDFGGTFDGCKVGYTWDSPDHDKGMPISPEVYKEGLD